MKAVIGLTVALGFASLAAPVMADVAWWRFDRIENRIDRRESIYDQRTDYTRGDVIEDWWDIRESRIDRRDGPLLPRFDRHEWRSLRRIAKSH